MQSTNKSNRKSFIYNNFTADPYPYPATTEAHPESFHPSISTGDPLPFRSRSNHIPVFSHDPRLSDSPHTENPPFRTMHTVWAVPFSVTPASPPVPEYRYRNPSALPPFRKFPGTAGSYSDFLRIPYVILYDIQRSRKRCRRSEGFTRSQSQLPRAITAHG